MSSIEQVPVVPRSDSSYTSHPCSDPFERTTKRRTRGKDHSKKNNKSKADKIIALRCELEGLKAEKSNAQQACRRAEIQRLVQREQQRAWCLFAVLCTDQNPRRLRPQVLQLLKV